MGLIEKVEARHLKADRPRLRPGQTVEILVRVVEGDKERQQKFRGEVISVRGTGLRSSFIVRKVTEGVGVERTFQLHSPTISEIKVMREARVRRSKLYYLRRKKGKAGRLTEKVSSSEVVS